MRKYRLKFKKNGAAIFISHLDLMRTFQRAFFRASIPVRHTQGFNPHSLISIALPLPVGFESSCEILDFEAEETDAFNIINSLNSVMPSGINILEAYEPERPFKELVFYEYEIKMKYGRQLNDEEISTLMKLFTKKPLVVLKKSKSGNMDADISECIKSLDIIKDSGGAVIRTVLTAQNPSLNPQYLISAIKTYEKRLTPEHTVFKRENIYSKDMKIFR